MVNTTSKTTQFLSHKGTCLTWLNVPVLGTFVNKFSLDAIMFLKYLEDSSF